MAGHKIADLVAGLDGLQLQGPLDVLVTGLTTDSRTAVAGTVFIAVRGTGQDGHDFLNSVVAVPGLAGVVVEDVARVPAGFKGTVIRVPDARVAVETMARVFYDHPSRRMMMIGVTGTNGKTTTTHMIEHLLNHLGAPSGVMGTIDHHLGARKWPSALTTPGPIELQTRLADFAAAGARATAMEVSSHALDQRRAAGVEFDVAVFTNLTRDHLDYHTTMERYFAAKEILFLHLLQATHKSNPVAVINYDDVYGRRLRLAAKAKLISYGLENGDLKATIAGAGFDGYDLSVRWGSQSEKMRVPLIGRFNVLNTLAAVGAVLGLSEKLNRAQADLLRACATAFADFHSVRGRLERVPNARGIHVFVDYAHTDDALKNVLSTLRDVRGGGLSRIIAVFGCGGDRDRGKRPLMGALAAELADEAIVTSDNPRTEDPDKIIDDIVRGVPSARAGRVQRLTDRRAAIHKALQIAVPGDAVLIAGKGHEDYQIIGKEKFHFDDVEVVKEYSES